ncbi:MAG: branched-chain amino acid ABC transporter permease [Acidimicrobiia bacterium]|nr:branched-chain amino acid ABC transporter permease [Acidimicrobiia bacterium]
MADLAQILVQMVTQGVIYALLAMGIAIVYRTSRVLNFAHGELMVVGVFVFYVLDTNPIRPLPYPVAAAVAIGVTIAIGMVLHLVAVESASWVTAAIIIVLVTAALAGRSGPAVWILGAPAAAVAAWALRRTSVRGLGGSLGWILGTIAFAVVLQEGLVALIGSSEDQQLIPGLFSSFGTIRLGSVVIAGEYVATAACAIVVVIGLDVIESRTRFGRAMKAVAANKEASALMGIDVRRVVYGAFALAAASAVVAGLLVTPLTFAKPTSGPTFTIIALTAALLGGIDSVRGAALGGLVLGALEIGLGRLLDEISRLGGEGAVPLLSLRNAIVMSLLIALLVLRPQGLFGGRAVEKV